MSANRALLLLPALLVVAACGKPPAAQQDLDSLDKELTADASGNARDPALTAALHDQIMVDPALTQSANTNVVRPPSRPDPLSAPVEPVAPRPATVAAAEVKALPAATSDCPACRKADGALTLGELAARQTPTAGDCTRTLSYSARWANRLPPELPLFPDARVREAAGSDACGLRVVSFASGAPVATVLGWYNARAARAGYSAEHQASGDRHVLGGTRGDAAYIVYATPAASGGSEIDLLVR